MIDEHVLARLRNQLSRGEPILFTGAGFSADAKSVTGSNLPNGEQLAKLLWELAFPGEEFDTQTKLGDIWHAARMQNANGVRELLRSTLTVDANELPEHYKIWFKMPWERCYTLNIDDIELAAARAFGLERNIRAVSATSDAIEGDESEVVLEFVHLNGGLSDDLEDLIFSDLDYGARNAGASQWYAALATDILSKPVVFVGTQLNESTLWQYVEFRKKKGARGTRELRPGSYLVCPNLNAARKVLLKELNISWIPMKASDFANEVLASMRAEAEEGHRTLRARAQETYERNTPRLIAELSAGQVEPASPEFLDGREPTWADIRGGLAAVRECDEDLYQRASASLAASELVPPLIVTGTAGSGKSTSLMRLGLRLSSDGIPVYWMDRRWNVKPFRLRELVLQNEDPIAILVDDSDMFGRAVSGWARELTKIRPGVLFAPAIRSNKIDGLLDEDTLQGVQPQEAVMPGLADSDIENLIQVLDESNKLGILKGLGHEERVAVFQREAGRQLLVAMIQATSGVKFKEKVYDEFAGLPEEQQLIYAIICLAHSQRFELDRTELLLASQMPDNETLNNLETLVRRQIVARRTLNSGYRARHRMIADELVNAASFRPFISGVLKGLCFAFSTRVQPDMRRAHGAWRKLIRFTNHEYIRRIIALDDARGLYASIEDLLAWDFQFWLQRGSLEVEDGNLDLATQYLNQAKSLAPGERNVATEVAYMLMKKAARRPEHASASDWFNEGREFLEDLISSRGKRDSYPFHVLGSQGLAWVRHGKLALLEKRTLLGSLLEHVTAGTKLHPRADELQVLLGDLKREWMQTTIEPQVE